MFMKPFMPCIFTQNVWLGFPMPIEPPVAQLRSLHSCSIFQALSSSCGVSSCASVPPNLTYTLLISLMHWDCLDDSWYSSAVIFWCIWQCLSGADFVISVIHSMRLRILLGALKKFWQRASGLSLRNNASILDKNDRVTGTNPFSSFWVLSLVFNEYSCYGNKTPYFLNNLTFKTAQVTRIRTNI